MTRTQIKQLMSPKRDSAAAQPEYATTAPTMEAPAETPAPAASPEPTGSQRPVLPPDVPQLFLPLAKAYGKADIIYEPRLLAVGRVHFVDTRKGLAADEDIAMLASLDTGALGIDWDECAHLELDPDFLEKEPPVPGHFEDVPADAGKAKSYAAWKKSLSDHIYRTRRFVLLKSAALKQISEPGESERDFRIRITDEAREQRDKEVAKLRKKFASKIDTIEERIRKAELRVDREAQEAKGAKMQTAISLGATVLSAVLGRRTFGSTTVGRAATAARGVGRSAKQADDVRRAQEDVEAYSDKLEELQEEVEREVDEIAEKYDADSIELEELLLKPRKADIDIRHVALAWAPFGRDAAGSKVPLFVK